MNAGNARYLTANDLPQKVAVFPLAGALLLPGNRLPLNIFEPRYLAMMDTAIAGNRLIGMIQPASEEEAEKQKPVLAKVGCLGRITSFMETGDGRLLITLTGVCRFRVTEELTTTTPFRQIQFAPFLGDLDEEDDSTVDRETLLSTFRDFLEANQLEADWDNVTRASNASLVNSLSMMAPFGLAEKQALLEAPDLKTRAETLIAITEIILARDADGGSSMLQ
ncbi:LON peptidase substrate-binding domain-containing protein [Rhizobium sp. L1K21]|uniref:LON peptidase substrate-binding domain-containing protein n=1 Tax=Rhizobium sp. L1K21 TaxID=2954933 RepID=UPI0020931E22|nr:LON peptidase substrate-binding domain-containing protein [Rhizobium sp. L1K21]MCO6188043.1 LON peptidase substrate-binding domain-containing protein [Rhizobium sp. L1K21]